MALRRGSVGRGMVGTLLAVIFVMNLIVVGLSSWSIDKYIDGRQHHHHLGGNSATTYMLVFALIAGVTGGCSVLVGLLHHRAWDNNSLAAAISPALISLALTALSFGLACKEIGLGGHRGRRLQTLEVFIVILTVTQLLYVGLLHAGMVKSKYGPGYHDHYSPMVSHPPSHQPYPTSPTPVV